MARLHTHVLPPHAHQRDEMAWSAVELGEPASRAVCTLASGARKRAGLAARLTYSHMTTHALTHRHVARRRRQVLNFRRVCMRELERLKADRLEHHELQTLFARWLERLK